MSTSVVSSVLLLKCSLVRSSVVQSSSATGSCECCEWLIPGRCSQQLNCYSRLYGQFACKLLPKSTQLYSSSSTLTNALFFHSKFKPSGKWAACNAIQHSTLPSWLLALHFSAIVWVLASTRGESCCHSQVYNCSTSSRDFPKSRPLFSSVLLQYITCTLHTEDHSTQLHICLVRSSVKQYTSSQINYEACLR